MLKKLQTISWGGWSAVLALVFFLGLAIYPVVAAPGKTDAKGKPDGLLAMIDKAKEKGAEAKMEKEHHGEKRLELKAVAATSDGTVYVGAKTGLFRVADGQLAPVAALPGADIKSLSAGPDGTLYVATKMGAYRVSADAATATSIHEGDVHSLDLAADGTLYLVTKHEGIQTSRDQGATWASLPVTLPAAPAKEMKGKEAKDHAHDTKSGYDKKAAPAAT